MRKYLHIGYPKNLSTTLQRGFFNVHPDICHLGIGCGSNIDYRDDTVNAFFENFVKYCCRAVYHDHRQSLMKHFQTLFAEAEDAGMRAVGASSEHLSFAFTADSIDTAEKAERVYEVFGEGTQIIMLIRNQYTMLNSLYREGVRVGYPGTYGEYINYVYRFQDRNFVSDFEYHRVYSLYAGLFGSENVHVLPFEDYVTSERTLRIEANETSILRALSGILGVSYRDPDPGHHNQALAPAVLEAKRRLNKELRHDLGNCLWDGAENHRLMAYYRSCLDLCLPEDEMFADVVRKRKLISQAEEKARTAGSTAPTVSYDCDRALLNRLLTRFEGSNKLLQTYLQGEKKALPDKYFNLAAQACGRQEGI